MTARQAIAAKFFTLCLFAAGACWGQELTPRVYWPAPQGMQVLTLGYGYQAGDIVTDPSLPIMGVDSRIHVGALAYQRTFGWFGRTSTLQFEVPFSRGTTRGEVEGSAERLAFSGPGDVSATLSVNLLGAPSMTKEQFGTFRADPKPVLAASLKILAPTGEYYDDRLVNIGTNRWAARARLGYIKPLKKLWIMEASAGVWFFQDNDEFLGQTREQNPVYALDLSLIRRLRPGFWASVDLNYYYGGRTYIDGVKSANLQGNSRLGVTIVYPFEGGVALRANFTTGLKTTAGGDFDTFGMSLIYLIP